MASTAFKSAKSPLSPTRSSGWMIPLGLFLSLVLLVVTVAGCRDNDSATLVEPEGPMELKLVWQDEFEGPAGQLPDSKKWRFDIGTDWGNDQLEFDTDRPENVSLDGEGSLAITVLKEFYEGQQYTSGRIKTQGLFAQARGRFEARIKLPIGQGIWPAFWLLGADFEQIGWPFCGEIDIMEYRGQEPTISHGSLHGPGYAGGGAITGRYFLEGSGFNADFHVFAIEWEKEKITWLIDDVPYQTFTPKDLPAGAQWVFEHSFFIILNVAVGGHFVGPPNAATTFPQTMLVDWVRVYGWFPVDEKDL